MNLLQDLAAWDESQHPRDKEGQFTDSSGADHPLVQKFVSGNEWRKPVLDAFAKKHGAEHLIEALTWYENKQRGPGGYYGEKLIDDVNAARKSVMSAKRGEKKSAVAERKAKVVTLLRERGFEVGDKVSDTETGTRGVLKLDSSGEPYIESNLGNRHAFGKRWQKMRTAEGAMSFLQNLAGWDESQHPRAKDGKFSDSGGGNSDATVENVQTILGDHSELSDTWIKATLDEDEGAFDSMTDDQIRTEFKKYAESAGETPKVRGSLGPRMSYPGATMVGKMDLRPIGLRKPKGIGRVDEPLSDRQQYEREQAKIGSFRAKVKARREKAKKLKGLEEETPMFDTHIEAAEAFKALIGPGHVHSDKWHRCWVKVQDQGHSSESAAAICTKSLGEDSFDRAAEALLEEESLEREVHLRAALGAPIRTEMYEGEEHLVVPVVALMEGVIHAVNAPEPEFVPASVLAASVASWNGRPVVLGHPTKDGRQISANDPRTLEAHRFGTIFATRMNGKLLGMEAWVNPKKLETLDSGLLAKIRNGEPIEVSVGAHVRTANAPGSHGGRAYSTAWRELMSDHLAFLPKTRGACSLEMGCGALRAAEGAPEYHIYEVLEGSFDLNRELEVDDEELELLVDDLRTAIGKRNNSKDQAMIQTVHDHAVELGATCGDDHRYASAWFQRTAAPLPDKAESKKNGNTKEVDCPHCDGMGQMNGKDCPYCDGSGKVYRAASSWFTVLTRAVKSLFLPTTIDWFNDPMALRTLGRKGSFLQDLAGWDESQHPRAKDGKFTDSSGKGGDSGGGGRTAVLNALGVDSRAHLGETDPNSREAHAHVWVDSTLDNNENAFKGKSSEQIKQEFESYLKSVGGPGLQESGYPTNKVAIRKAAERSEKITQGSKRYSGIDAAAHKQFAKQMASAFDDFLTWDRSQILDEFDNWVSGADAMGDAMDPKKKWIAQYEASQKKK